MLNDKKTNIKADIKTTFVDLQKLSNSGAIRFKYKLLFKLIMSLPAFKKIQTWHDRTPIKEDFREYIDSFIQQMQINIEHTCELNIPKTGRCIFVANHPTGLLEVCAWISTIMSVRSDLKLLANNWFDLLSAAQNSIICVDPFDSKASYKSNIKSIIEAKKWLEQEGALMIFPAGEVAHWNWSALGVEDPPWKKSVLSLANKTNAKIIPCYSASKNSLLFNVVGNIHPRLRTLMLAREFTTKQKKTIKIATNNDVSTEYLDSFKNQEDQMAFLRLSSEALNDKPFVEHLINYQEIIEKQANELIEKDFTLNKVQKYIDTDLYTVFIAYGRDIPNVMREVGRIREYSFRLLGEGTGLSSDTDYYDKHYKQIILWDKKEARILGGLRVGYGDDIHNQGLYLLDFVKVKPQFDNILKQSMDFGRLFVVEDAPKDINCVLILFKTLASFILDSKYKYLIGQVSIPSAYPKLAIDIITTFLREYYQHEEISKYIKGKKRYRRTIKHKKYIYQLLPYIKTDKEVNKLLCKLFQDRIEIPALFRFYIKCNSRLIAINHDKDFGSVDALMLFDKEKIPRFFQHR